MSYVPNVKWDLFVSYAHNDAKFISGNWIYDFTQKLVQEIESGLLGNISVFFDQVEQKAFNTIECIVQQVRESGVLLVIASPNWIKSDWCNRELIEFLKRHPDTSRVVVAEIEPPDGEITFPGALPNNTRTAFFELAGPKQTPLLLEQSSKEFRLTLKTFAKDIRDRLMQLRDRSAGARRPQQAFVASSADVTAQAFDGTHSVLIASCTGEVREEHEAFVAYLASQGVRVAEMAEGPWDSRDSFEADFGALLNQADIFVQLLGPKKLPAGALGISPSELQFQLALASGKEMMLWLPDWLDPQRIADSDYQNMLLRARNGSAVPELACAVLDKLRASSARETLTPQTDRIVVINADPEDFDFAADLVRACSNSNCTAILDDCEVNEVSRANWAMADAIAFVQGNVTARWLTARVGAAHRERAAANAPRSLRGQAAIYAPPPPKKLGFVGGSNVTELDLSHEWEPAKFADWVDRMVTKPGS